ncbi:MAG: hypothetical protein JO007_13225 [Alphaproteobacteria bacterium]|nr:hypothetical protein [Alphaproteobacteria bacterium]
MLRVIAIATAALVTVAAPALAQANRPLPPSPGTGPAAILGPTGTMYDGNNSKLQVPPEQDAWYKETFAGFIPAQPVIAAGATSATGKGTATSLGTTVTGGEH